MCSWEIGFIARRASSVPTSGLINWIMFWSSVAENKTEQVKQRRVQAKWKIKQSRNMSWCFKSLGLLLYCLASASAVRVNQPGAKIVRGKQQSRKYVKLVFCWIPNGLVVWLSSEDWRRQKNLNGTKRRWSNRLDGEEGKKNDKQTRFGQRVLKAHVKIRTIMKSVWMGVQSAKKQVEQKHGKCCKSV